MLNTCDISWTFYAEGYDSFSNDKVDPNACFKTYDASDNPFTYFPNLTNCKTEKFNFRDLDNLIEDLQKGTLPAVSYVKGLGNHSEHPGYYQDRTFLEGQKLSKKIYELIQKSEKHKNNTILFLLPDESGGFYDHVTPPQASDVDGMPYGARTHFIALGNQVKKNYISHVQMEPSSIIRFIEWNWLGKEGQLNTRDSRTNNIGDMIDPAKAGIKVPSKNKHTNLFAQQNEIFKILENNKKGYIDIFDRLKENFK